MYLTPPREVEFKVTSMIPASPKVLYITGADVGFTKLRISVNKQLLNVRITIKAIETLPANVPELKDVYKYIEITKENMQDEDIDNVVFEFKVPKSWLEGKDPSKVVLYRFDGSEWKVLPTKVISESSVYVYYEATSPGLSFFAIALAPVPEEKPPEEVEEKKCPVCPPCTEWSACIEGKQTRTCYKCDETTNYKCVAYEETRGCKVEKPKEKKPPGEITPPVEEKHEEKGKKPMPITWIAIAIIAIVAVIGAVLYFYSKKSFVFRI
jgi:PGF-pre-PGF domain-containing protein